MIINSSFGDNFITICFCVNDAYISQTAVAIQSIKSNSTLDHNYDIVILYSDVSSENKSRIERMKCDNVSIRCIDISSLVEDMSVFTANVYTKTKYSKEAYYRIFIPSLFPHLDKVVYLDGDMVICDDIYELLEYELGDCFIAGVRDYCGIASCYVDGSDRLRYRVEELQIESINDYIISATLIFNVRKYNQCFDVHYLKNLSMSRDWRQHDQDLLNHICKNKIKIIDPEWGVIEEPEFNETYLPIQIGYEYIRSLNNPKIVHFAAGNKAWTNKKSKFNDLFWKYAHETEFFEFFYNLIGDDCIYKYHIFHEILKKQVEYSYRYGSVLLSFDHRYIGELNTNKMCIEFISIIKGTICISGFMEEINYLGNGAPRLYAYVNGSQHVCSITKRKNCMEKNVDVFNFNISLKIKSNVSIKFNYTYDEIHFIMPTWVAVEQFSPINENPNSYCTTNGYLIEKKNGDELCITIDRKWVGREIKLIRSIGSKKSLKKYRMYYNFLRVFKPSKDIIIIASHGNDGMINLFKKMPKKLNAVFVEINKLGDAGYRRKYIINYLQSKAIISTVYDPIVYFPLANVTRADEIRDIVYGKKMILIQDDTSKLKWIRKSYHGISNIITSSYEVRQYLLSLDNGIKEEEIIVASNPAFDTLNNKPEHGRVLVIGSFDPYGPLFKTLDGAHISYIKGSECINLDEELCLADVVIIDNFSQYSKIAYLKKRFIFVKYGADYSCPFEIQDENCILFNEINAESIIEKLRNAKKSTSKLSDTPICDIMLKVL